jgi:acetyltransferase-like isoleucine patch superfamily enzyme
MFRQLFMQLLRTLKSEKQKVLPCGNQGRVNLIERHGGCIEVHATALLNSQQDGYHVGMPFETTLIADAPGAKIKVGEFCRIHGTYIHAWGSIIIGRHVLIAAGTNIIDSNGHSSDVRYARFRQNFRDVPRAITIGDYVWIGMNAMVLKGVEIGDCAIVAAGSVVKESVPPFAVVEGNPAKIVRMLDQDKALESGYPLEKLSLENGFFRY